MFFRLLGAEFRKLREVMTLLTLLAGPGLVGVLSFVGAAVRRREVEWSEVAPNMASFWGMLLFPLAFVALAAFAAQVEHRARAWDHLLMLPMRKWQVYAVKAAMMVVAAAIMNVLFVGFTLGGAMLGGLISPAGPFNGPIPVAALVKSVSVVAAAALFMIAVQTWLSLRFNHFILPILIGIGGVACAIAGMIFRQTDRTRFLPWATPNDVLMRWSTEGPDAERMLAYGVAGGLLAFVAMCIHLSRREMR